MTLLSWTGDATRAVNLWRRWYLAHILPRPNGQPLRRCWPAPAPMTGEEFTAATEANQIRLYRALSALRHRPRRLVDRRRLVPLPRRDRARGWWRDRHLGARPGALSPTGCGRCPSTSAESGRGLLVWFEPERVRPGTWLDLEHPEWLLRLAGDDNAPAQPGQPGCRQWLTDHVCRLIQDNGIGIYRQDFNFAPLEYWRGTSPPTARA